MSDQILKEIHGIFLDVDKRAERSTADVLEATFVDSQPLYELLATRNHQVIYGRRGTGKTHALRYLQKQIEDRSELAIYIDLRNVGSNGSIYADPARELAERAGVLVRDVLQSLLDTFYAAAVAALDTAPDPTQITSRLDDFQNAISHVKVTGPVEWETTASDKKAAGREIGISGNIASQPSAKIDVSIKNTTEKSNTDRFRRSGNTQIHINFGEVSSALAGLVSVLGVTRAWILLDEWSEVPLVLQPYLADLIRRTILPERLLTVKIAAIEHRSRFAVRGDRGEYTGIELGADVAADLNLDDFLVFESNHEKSIEFFKSLLFKHLCASPLAPPQIKSPDDLIQVLFTQAPVFEEFVRAVEGVPRDALNLVTKMVTRAWGQKVAMSHIRGAAKDWYNQDKARDVANDSALGELLSHIVDEVIGARRARAFLFRANSRNEEIDELFDLRVLHILKKGVSTHDEPGARYDVYKIDYGCYVELINTSKAPLGLYRDDDGFVEVPKDDHRSIRRAILRIEDLGKAPSSHSEH